MDNKDITIYNKLYEIGRRYISQNMFYNNIYAEDILQDTIIYIWSRHDKLNNIDSIEAYFYTSLYHTDLLYRKKSKARDILLRGMVQELKFYSLPNPDNNEEKLKTIVDRILSEHNFRTRDIFTMKVNGIRSKEIEKKYNTSKVSVSKTFIRIKDKIKKRLSEEYQLTYE